MTDIGRAGMVTKGDYNSASTYETLDAVSYQNGLYVAKQNVPAGILPTNTTYWQSAIDAANIVGAITNEIPQDISNRLSNLCTAVAEQNLEKYGYKIGDYFRGKSQQNNYVYRIADMDTFYGGYDYFVTKNTHHIALVVDTLTDSQWHNEYDISNVGYESSTLHGYLSGTVLNVIKADMIALFGGSTGFEHLLGQTKLWNKLGAWDWSDTNTQSQYISALTEAQLAGMKIWSADKYQQGEGHKQLKLFSKYCFNQIFGWNTIWLRSISGSVGACSASDSGFISESGVTENNRAVGIILFH